MTGKPIQRDEATRAEIGPSRKEARLNAVNERERLLPVSPELVLVDPELAVVAREALPDPGAWTSNSSIAGAGERSAVAQLMLSAQARAPEQTARIVRGRRLGRFVLVTLAALLSAASGFAVALLVGHASEASLLRDADTTIPVSTFPISTVPISTVPVSRRTPGAVRTRRPRQRETVAPAGRKRDRAAPLTQPPQAVRRAKQQQQSLRKLTLSRSGVTIGRFAIGKRARAPGAVAAFGAPTRRTAGRFYCHLTWRRLGLRMTFYDLRGRAPCSRGAFARAVISGKSWRTAKGVPIGASVASLRRGHPGAAQRSAGWWSLLRIQRRTFEPWRPDPGVAAQVRRGRVVAFYVT